MKSFDPLLTPLSGTNLIEASAGTGKTYAIEGLFLRLILERRLPIEQILVVTFTKAATEELKSRIRTRLAAALAALAQGTCTDPLIVGLIKKSSGEDARLLLQNALMNFDLASIFTIHGFCQRILHEHAFETGSLFDTDLITDQTDLQREVADDFWRTHIYRADPEVVSYAMEKLKGPEYFLKLTQQWQTPGLKILPKVAEPLWQSLRPYRKTFEELQTAWPGSRSAVAEALQSPVLKDNIYGSLKSKNGGADRSVREIKVMLLLSAMDGFSNSPGYAATVFKDIDKFTTTKLLQSVKSGQPAPRLNFFELCDELVQRKKAFIAELESYLLYLKTEFFQYAAAELSVRKKERNVQFFNDLLLTVQNALAETAGNALAAAIRQKYQAALVDEFQDTDPVQYEIFYRLFSSDNHVLFMIGDPKQAIYGFRGADIFTYLRASRTAPRKYTLTENWRSDQGMITAVNTLFGRVRYPFIFKEIAFSKGTSGRKKTPATDTPQAAMTIWHIKGEGRKPLSKKIATDLAAAQVAAEIVHLLGTTPEPSAPGDMAVLVRTNRQAQLMKTVLSRVRVPAVLSNTGNVFRSHEAVEMERLLASIAEPANERRLRAALVTDMLGMSAEMIFAAGEGTTEWESRRMRMREYYHLWEQHGFMRMLRQLLVKEKIRPRLLSFPDGERRLTNVLHLAELLQHESVEKTKGQKALIKWLAEQRKNSATGSDAHQLRLESDADAVKIVTIHKSKGLEYPIVFCPFLWDGSLLQGEELCFHDPVDEVMTLDLSGKKNARHLSLSTRELLAENIRLLYVAVTRAQKRCYLAWGRINTAETAPLSYLFHYAADGPDDDIAAALQNEIPQKSDADLIHDLEKLAGRSGGSIRIAALPEKPVGNVPTGAAKAPDGLLCRKFAGKTDWDWRISSYSTLVSRAVPAETLPDRDAADHAAVTIPPETDSAADAQDIFSFPKGSHAGNFFHDIFENMDFRKTDDADCSRLTELKLAEYGFNPAWKETVCRTIRNVVALPLPGSDGEFTLSSIPKQDRLNEMEFYFPLALISPRKLKKIFSDCGVFDVADPLPECLENLVFAPARGFMKGFMDLVFRFQDRFYLIDWKSNFLGATLQDYRRSALAKVMQREFYFLQYQIYTLAVHQYLQRRISGYRYEKNFGGVFYIFLRGVDPVQGPEYGIFRDLPSPDSVYSLANALIPAPA